MRCLASCFTVLLAANLGWAQEVKTSYPALPEAFSSFGAAVCDGHVYVYGGHVGKTHTYSTEAVTGKFRRLKLEKPTAWEELPGGPGLQGLAMVSHGGKLYRIGGMQPRNKVDEDSDNHSVATVAAYDPKTKSWTALPDLPAPRSSHDATIVGDQIVVAGGWQMNGVGKKSVWHDHALILDLTKKPLQWEKVEQPFKRRALNVASVQGKVFVLGGMGPDARENAVDILDLKTRQWSEGPSLPAGKRNGFTPAACAAGDKVLLSPADGKVYCLNGKHTAWEECSALEKQRIVHRMVAPQADLLIVLGGASSGGNVALVEGVRLKARP